METITAELPFTFPRNLRSDRAVSENFLDDYSMRSYHAGRCLYDNGRHQHAINAFKYGLMHDPGELRLHLMLIVTYMGLKMQREVDHHLEIIRRLRLSPGLAESMQDIINKWNFVPNCAGILPNTTRNEQPHFTTSLLGIDGQFGNSIFQYAFGRIYAEKHDMQYEAYDWIGRKLFGLTDASISSILPFILEIEYQRLDILDICPLEAGLCDRDSQGYFQHNTKIYAPYKERFVSFFQPTSIVKWVLQPFVNEIRKYEQTLVAIHLRLGDAAGQGRLGKQSLYLDWLRALWPSLEKPVLFLASDDLPATCRTFAEFNPITSEHLHLPFSGAEFYPDFYVLTQADYLGAGNSTFSFAASMLNDKARLIVRPNHENTELVPYDPWSSKPTA